MLSTLPWKYSTSTVQDVLYTYIAQYFVYSAKEGGACHCMEAARFWIRDPEYAARKVAPLWG